MLLYGVLAVLLVWLIVLSVVLYKTRTHYLNLVNRTRKQSIDEILDTVLEHSQKLHHETEKIKKEIAEVVEKSRFYFQKLGLVRFNPFGKTSSDQSFVLALMDRENNGIVINFIYTHEGVRIYTKRVKEGKGEEYALSDEEHRAIQSSA